MNNYKKLDISFLNRIKCELPELKNSDITKIDSFSDGSNGKLTELVRALQLAIDVKELITKLSDNGVPPPILDINNEAVCLTFKNGNICIYIEYYFDGDIGLISEDLELKTTIEDIDLKREEVFDAIVKYYGG